MKLSKWIRIGEELYVGETIVGVRYLTPEEADIYGFWTRSPVLVLSNGVEITPLQDDEGNSGGALGQILPWNGEGGQSYCGSILPTVPRAFEDYQSKMYSNETPERASEREDEEERYIKSVILECKETPCS